MVAEGDVNPTSDWSDSIAETQVSQARHWGTRWTGPFNFVQGRLRGTRFRIGRQHLLLYPA